LLCENVSWLAHLAVGIYVGLVDGTPVGAVVCVSVGILVGTLVELVVGMYIGAVIGIPVGIMVGTLVEEVIGVSVREIASW
jgi:hypothetical protein